MFKTGMEMMLSNLIGMSPEEMQSAVTKTISAIENAGKMLASIDERLKVIEEKLNIEGEQSNGHSAGRQLATSKREYISL